ERAGKGAGDDADPAMGALVEAPGGPRKVLDGPMITGLAQPGGHGSRELLGELGTWLGRGMASIFSLLDPDVIVVGGGVADAGDLLLDPARRAYSASLTGRAHREPARFVLAGLGNRAGIVGAADLAR